MKYEEYYLEEGKTSKEMAKKIKNKEELEHVCQVLIDHKIGGWLTSDGWVLATNVGIKADSRKAKVCKDLGFKYISISNVWIEKILPNGVVRIRELGL